MKFRSKSIINTSIIALRILLPLWIFMDEWTLKIFIFFVFIFIILFIFRYKNYVELDDLEIKQVKFNLLFKEKIKTIPYKDISQIEFGKNHTLSEADKWKQWHQIYSITWDTIEIWKIFHLKKFKELIKEKICIATGKNLDQETWNRYTQNLNVFKLDEWFVKLNDEIMFISDNFEWIQKTFNIKYSNIEQIEIVIFSDKNSCFYIKLKNEELKEAFYGLKNWYTFLNDLKNKWINIKQVSEDEKISNLKPKDLY